jgi:hypothetical protein
MVAPDVSNGVSECCGCEQEQWHAGDLFIACAAFQQQIPGYVFTTRDEGLGYYKDAGMNFGLDKQSQDHAKQQSASVASTMQGRQLVCDLLQPRLRSPAAAEELD